MTSATVVLDQVVAPVPGGIGRYALNLVRALSMRPMGRTTSSVSSRGSRTTSFVASIR